jgi:hypothetical protein
MREQSDKRFQELIYFTEKRFEAEQFLI